jgi:hypothetical protein
MEKTKKDWETPKLYVLQTDVTKGGEVPYYNESTNNGSD